VIVDPALCPACGAANQCALAEPADATPNCWCHSVSIAAEIIERLPEHLRDRACLCPRCAEVLDQLHAP
jgi:hypothetical protein